MQPLIDDIYRFDAAHHDHVTTTRSTLTELPNLWRYAREPYARPGWGSTVDVDHITRHCYGTQQEINPTGVVPTGPDLTVWPSATPASTG